MDAWQSFKRKREMRKMKRASGVKAGRGGRRATGGRMVLSPKEPADVHELMSQDAQPNIRVWQMWDEACDFEHELSHFRDNLSKFENATDEFLKRIEPVMRAPLPRVWDAVEGGLAEPTRATISHGHQHTVGGDVSIAGLEEARSEYHNRLRGHVIRPLHQWSEALGVVEERLPELKRLRGEVVKASRAAAKSSRNYRSHAGDMDTFEDAGGAGAMVPYNQGGNGNGGGGGIRGMLGGCGKPQAGSGQRKSRGARRQQQREQNIEDDYFTDSDDEAENDYSGRETGVDRTTRQEIDMEEAGMRLNYKHRKLQASRADYDEADKLIAEQLTGLQRDAAWTKSYMVAALLLTKECMQTSVVSLGNTKQPLPGFQSRGSLLSTRHGELLDNVDLAGGMPEDVNIGLFEHHMRGGLPMASLGAGGRREVAALPPSLHAHAATAAPMELHARPDVSALDRLNTPPTGAHAIPMSALAGLNLEEEGTGRSVQGYGQQPIHHRDTDDHYTTSPTSTAPSSFRGLDFRPSATYSETAIASSPRATAIGGGSAGLGSSSAAAVGGSSGAVGSSGGNVIAAGSSNRGVVGGSGVSVLRGDQSEYVCGSKTFTEVEDRTIVRERVETIVEHHPVQKEYRTEVRYVGEAPLAGSTEHIDTRERIVSTTPPGPKCPASMTSSGACAAPSADTTAFASAATATGAATATAGRPGVSSHRLHRRSSSSTSSSSSSSSDSSGDEAKGYDSGRRRERRMKGHGYGHSSRGEEQFSYRGSKGYSRAHQVVPEAPLSMGTQRSASLKEGLGGHANWAGAVGGDVSVLREDNRETVCGRQEFTEVEDRPIIRERVETIVEHHPVQKEYRTEVRFTGETPLAGSAEVIGNDTRVVQAAPVSLEERGAVRHRTEFADVEDRTAVRERVETIVEHRPVEKEYLTEVRFTGEAPLAGSAEVISNDTRVVQAAPVSREERGAVRHRTEFADVEDRTAVRERVETIVEHRPVEKEYLTEVRFTGKAPLPGSAEVIGNDTRVVQEAAVSREERGAVRHRTEFADVEDRPIVKERVERTVEHRPVEKEYVTEVRFTGEAPLPGSSEVMSDNTRVVEVAKPGPKCPNNVCQATNTAAAPAGVEDSHRTQRV